MGPGKQSNTCKGPGACMSLIIWGREEDGRSLSFVLNGMGLWIIKNLLLAAMWRQMNLG